MVRFLLSLRQKIGEENSLSKLLARDNQMIISPRFLAVLGDLLVFHNRVLKFIDLFSKASVISNYSDMNSEQKNDKEDIIYNDGICYVVPISQAVKEWEQWIKMNSSV